jgi:uncharacterized protein (TIGR00106 family)
MHVTIDLSIVPIGVGLHLSDYVAACETVLDEAGLKHELHANGTDIEGEWDDVFAAVKGCHDKLREMGAPRVYGVIKSDVRFDGGKSMEDKVRSVQA